MRQTTTLSICRQRGLRISTATADITLMWRQHGRAGGYDRSVGRRTTAFPPLFVRTLPAPQVEGGYATFMDYDPCSDPFTNEDCPKYY